jgi:hypothetical protein
MVVGDAIGMDIQQVFYLGEGQMGTRKGDGTIISVSVRLSELVQETPGKFMGLSFARLPTSREMRAEIESRVRRRPSGAITWTRARSGPPAATPHW